MILPFDRARLAERNRLDLAQAVAEASSRMPQERLQMALELSDLAWTLRRVALAELAQAAGESLERKARVYVRPLSKL